MGQFATRSLVACWILLTVGSAVQAQLLAPTVTRVPAVSAVIPAGTAVPEMVPMPTAERQPVVVATSPVLRQHQNPKVVALPQDSHPGVKVGSTWYDFQTNAAMPERVAFFADGSDKYLQVLWMAATDGTRDAATRIPGFNNSRGSYYNFVDANDPENLVVGVDTWKKMEDQRAGWPSTGQFSDGSIGTASHTPVKFYRNAGVGDDFFYEFSAPTSAADTALWPRVAIDGQDNVHLIYHRAMPDGTGQLVYRRSTNGGTSWEPEVFFTGPNGVLPVGQTGTLPNSAGGDTYAIAARGPIVAVVYSDSPLRTLVRKSTDYGRTWNDPNINSLILLIPQNHTFIDSTITGANEITLYSDTTVVPSSHHAVTIDNTGRIHVATGQSLTYVITKGSIDPNANDRRGIIYSVDDDALYRGTGIYYWPEGDSLLYTVGVAGDDRWDGEGAIVSRRAYSGASRYPNLGVDENNNVYMVYTSVKTGDHMEMQIDTTPRYAALEPDTLVTVNGLFGHIYGTWKYASNPNWSRPVSLTPDGTNCLFGTLCDDVVDNTLYFAYSASAVPGDRVTNVETEAAEADVMVAAMDRATWGLPTSVQEVASLDAAVAIMPNPSDVSAQIRIATVTPGEITVSLYTVQGERLIRSVSPAATGEWMLEIPTQQLATGSYLLTVEQHGAALTRTLNVLH